MYIKHYKAFSQNTNFAARVLHYYLHLGTMAKPHDKEYNALNKTARFWNDFNFMALQTTIIFLGKIFDAQKRAHSLTKLIEVLPHSLEYFSKSMLKERKMALGEKFDWLEAYMEDAHELTLDDVEVINAEADKAKALWKKFAPLRHQVYAHNQMLTNEQRDALYNKVTYDELEELVQILLNISFALEQAEINGRKPDFKNNYESPINQSEGEINRLLNILTKGSNAAIKES